MVAATIATLDPPPEACPRCSGRVVVATDPELGRQFNCLVCGYNPPTAADRKRLASITREEQARPGKLRRRQPSHGYHKI